MKYIATIKPISFFIACILLSFTSMAETVKIPLAAQGAEYQNIKRPSPGMSMEKVEAMFGAPIEISNSVGQPPIIKWTYERYTVYFENKTVLHSVLHNSDSTMTAPSDQTNNE